MIMVAVFGIFVTLPIDVKQMGFGLAVADPDRRDRHPRRAAPGGDEAARRMELVPAAWLEWLPNLSAEPRVSDEGEARRARPAVTPG